MSLNTAHANGGVLIYNGEMILLYCDGVEMIFEGNDVKDFGGSKKGRLYLTTHRMIFTNKNTSDRLQSFSFPFFSMSAIELEQPVFGANFIKGTVTAQVGGNWTGRSVFKLKFMSGGAIEYGQAMMQAAKMASRYMPAQPPAYNPHSGPYYPAPPPAYSPAPAPGFNVPTDVFPDRPPPNSVFTSNVPPPYPGIYAPPYAGPPQGGNPPQNGYPQQQGGYQPQGGFQPPQGGPYPQQQGGPYPQQQGGPYPQQQGGYPNMSGMPDQPPSYSYNATAAPSQQPGFNPNWSAMSNGSVAAPNPSNPKEQEAMGFGYYNPANPGQVYVPQPYNAYPQQPPQYQASAPPPYYEASKKQQ